MPKKTDSNQAQIVGELRQLGATVVSTHSVGHGFPDLVISYHGFTFLVEVKNPDVSWKLTKDELEFQENWKGCYIIGETTEQIAREMDDWINNKRSDR